jgi:hypothetical protein
MASYEIPIIDINNSSSQPTAQLLVDAFIRWGMSMSSYKEGNRAKSALNIDMALCISETSEKIYQHSK